MNLIKHSSDQSRRQLDRGTFSQHSELKLGSEEFLSAIIVSKNFGPNSPWGRLHLVLRPTFVGQVDQRMFSKNVAPGSHSI
jgi:hypothetical protein